MQGSLHESYCADQGAVKHILRGSLGIAAFPILSGRKPGLTTLRKTVCLQVIQQTQSFDFPEWMRKAQICETRDGD